MGEAPQINGVGFEDFLGSFVQNEASTCFEISDKGWEKEGRGAVVAAINLGSDGTITLNGITMGYMSLTKVKDVYGYSVPIIDMVDKYNHRSEAPLIMSIHQAGEDRPFIASVALRRTTIQRTDN